MGGGQTPEKTSSHGAHGWVGIVAGLPSVSPARIAVMGRQKQERIFGSQHAIRHPSWVTFRQAKTGGVLGNAQRRSTETCAAIRFQ